MKYLFASLLFLASASLFAQSISPEVKAVLDTAITYSKTESMYAATTNWDSLEPLIYEAAAQAQSVDDLGPAFQVLINGLRDHHARVMKANDYSTLAYFTDWSNARTSDRRKRDQAVGKVMNDTTARFEYALFPNRVGYLKIVGVGPQIDGQTEASRIRAGLAELHSQEVDHWIVDLRYNTGGNINVMLAGIAPLLDKKNVVSIQDLQEEELGRAQIKKGNFFYFDFQAFQMPKKPKVKRPKIALLTSRWTVSSGELIAVAFKGQKNTRFFGEATGGYTTNNGWEVVNNEVALIMSTGIYCDRNGDCYEQWVEPDVEIPFVLEADPAKDEAIRQATAWLKSQ